MVVVCMESRVKIFWSLVAVLLIMVSAILCSLPSIVMTEVSSTVTVKDAAIFLNPVLREAVVLFIGRKRAHFFLTRI